MHSQGWFSLRRQPSFGGRFAHPFSTPSRIAVLMLIVMVVVCVSESSFSVAHAKDCITRGPEHMSVWKHKEGSFQCNNCIGAESAALHSRAARRRWTEYDKDRHAVNTFLEGHRDNAQVVLEDDKRGVSILLRHDLSGIRNEGEQSFRQLYQGTFISVVDCT
ncbi:hypothetical protein JKF63_05120 [Porcisia hertigi]|uniref:Uncharacterized protein n=1 Tax=Porcisia hertigi TaxID=2761500 RepID=A0A836I5Z2_9TRYP|nr:hypothetical protein JKF63_05120 [Porcisia hertigi]